jgi:hypothetical protein
MKKIHILFFLFSILALGLSSCYYDNEEELYPAVITCDTISVSYSSSVAPILTSSCNGCHSSASPSGGVVLDSYSQASVYALNGKL